MLRAALAAALPLVVSGCGLVAAVIPPVDVGDPLGVAGRVVEARVQDGAIAPQSVTHVDETTSFDLADLEQELYGFGVAALYVEAGLAAEAELSGADIDAAPTEFTVQRAVVAATLSDTRHAPVVFREERVLDLRFVLVGCAVTACTYRYAGSGDLATALSFDVTERAKLDALVAILVAGPEPTPNSGTFRVAMEFNSEPSLAGYTLRFTLASSGTKLKVG